jgi:hypothetical protein
MTLPEETHSCEISAVSRSPRLLRQTELMICFVQLYSTGVEDECQILSFW